MTAQAHRYRTRDEWLRARRIGSSDVAQILGLSRYGTAYDVWDRLVYGPRPTSHNAEQLRGLRLEPRILASYAERTGRQVAPTPPHTLYTREQWASSTPDAIADGDVLVEAKTDREPSRWGPEIRISRWSPEVGEVVRPDYYLQVQHQLWTLDLRSADLAVLLPGDDPFLPELRVYRIERDEALVDRMAVRLRAWWDRHVAGREPPELDDSEGAARALGRIERSGERQATRDEAALAERYVLLAEQEKTARDQKRATGRSLVHLAGRVQRLDLPRGRVQIVQGVSAAQLDEGALLADRPDLAPVLDRYRRPGNPYAYPRITATKQQE